MVLSVLALDLRAPKRTDQRALPAPDTIRAASCSSSCSTCRVRARPVVPFLAKRGARTLLLRPGAPEPVASSKASKSTFAMHDPYTYGARHMCIGVPTAATCSCWRGEGGTTAAVPRPQLRSEGTFVMRQTQVDKLLALKHRSNTACAEVSTAAGSAARRRGAHAHSTAAHTPPWVVRRRVKHRPQRSAGCRFADIGWWHAGLWWQRSRNTCGGAQRGAGLSGCRSEILGALNLLQRCRRRVIGAPVLHSPRCAAPRSRAVRDVAAWLPRSYAKTQGPEHMSPTQWCRAGCEHARWGYCGGAGVRGGAKGCHTTPRSPIALHAPRSAMPIH